MMFANRDEHACPHGIAQNHLIVDQRVRGLKNAVVFLEDAPGDASPAVRLSPLSTQKCVLTPRVQWLVQGSSLRLENKDGASHHLRALWNNLTAFEVDLPDAGAAVRRPFIHVGFYKINCDRHGWERAWVYVSAHPYVAITDKEGGFMIPEIPPGRYTIHAWHEGWVEKGKDADGRIEYQAMGETLPVKVQRGRVTEVLLDNLEPEEGE